MQIHFPTSRSLCHSLFLILSLALSLALFSVCLPVTTATVAVLIAATTADHLLPPTTTTSTRASGGLVRHTRSWRASASARGWVLIITCIASTSSSYVYIYTYGPRREIASWPVPPEGGFVVCIGMGRLIAVTDLG